MTVAVCLKCGAMKHGAWSRCAKCRHDPKDLEDRVKHMLTSDNHFTPFDLEDISTRVRTGQPLEFNSETVMAAVTTLKDGQGVVALLRWLWKNPQRMALEEISSNNRGPINFSQLCALLTVFTSALLGGICASPEAMGWLKLFFVLGGSVAGFLCGWCCAHALGKINYTIRRGGEVSKSCASLGVVLLM